MPVASLNDIVDEPTPAAGNIARLDDIVDVAPPPTLEAILGAMKPVPAHGPVPAPPVIAPAAAATPAAPLDPAAAAWKASTPGSGAPMPPMSEFAKVPILGDTVTGAMQLASGVPPLVRAAASTLTSPVPPRPAGITPRATRASMLTGQQPPTPAPIAAPETMNAASDVLEGGFKMLEPLLLVGGMTAPVQTIVALVGSMGAAKTTQLVSQKMGLSPELTRLLADVTGAIAAGASVPVLREGLQAGAAWGRGRMDAAAERATWPIDVKTGQRVPPVPSAPIDTTAARAPLAELPAGEPPVAVPAPEAGGSPAPTGTASLTDIVAAAPPPPTGPTPDARARVEQLVQQVQEKPNAAPPNPPQPPRAVVAPPPAARSDQPTAAPPVPPPAPAPDAVSAVAPPPAPAKLPAPPSGIAHVDDIVEVAPEKPAAAFVPWQRVRAEEGEGTIHLVRDGNVKIQFDDGGKLSNWIPASRVTAIEPQTPAAPPTKARLIPTRGADGGVEIRTEPVVEDVVEMIGGPNGGRQIRVSSRKGDVLQGHFVDSGGWITTSPRNVRAVGEVGVQAPKPAPPVPEKKSLHVRTFEYLRDRLAAKGLNSFPKHAGEFRKNVAAALGIPEKQFIDNIDALNDPAEAALATHLKAELGKAARPLAKQIELAQTIEAALPRAQRTLEKTKLQQFSTPLPIAVAVAHAAQIEPGDHVLEPTAGTGNLVAPVRAGASVAAGEFAPRRADLLRAQGYDVTQGDYLAGKFKQPTVIVSNPPWGKYSTGKYRQAVGLDFAPGDVAERFVAKMLRDVAPGGRVVAVMPTTMLDTAGRGFRQWLSEHHTVQAIIKSPPKAYDTRATNVESVLLVVDKGKAEGAPRIAMPATVDPADWRAYAEAVEGIPGRAETRNLRRADTEHGAVELAGDVQPPADNTGRSNNVYENPTPEAASNTAPERGPGGVRERPGSELADHRRDAGVRPGRAADVVAEIPGRAAELDASHDTRSAAVAQRGRSEERPAAEPTGEFADVVDHTKVERREAAGSRFFAPYLRRSTLRGVGHPKLVVEARQLAGVPYPPLTIKPGQAITTALQQGRVSVEQAEQALAAVQANVVGHHGYLAADGVGVGKSREIALTILDLMERAKKDGRDLRLLVTTKSADNIQDLIDTELYYVARGRTRDGRDLNNLDVEKQVPEGLDFEVVPLSAWPQAKKDGQEYKPLPSHKRAIYVTDFYNLAAFRQAIVDVQPHGILGDEAHRFKNVEGAAAGGAWQNLHAEILRGVKREDQVFAYFTATPAQTIEDYQYLYGLRLWPIDGFADWLQLVTGHADEEFADKLAAATEAGAKDLDGLVGSKGADVVGGDAETVKKTDKPKWGSGQRSDVFTARLTPAEAEQIPREWKMLGRFSARDLWRDGQEFTIHQATLPPKHKAKYDQFVALAQDIAKKAYQFGLLDKTGQSTRFGVTGQLQFAAKRIQMQPALEEAITLAKQKVAEGYQVVLSVLNVSEMDPEKGNIAAAIEKINTREKDEDPDDPDGGVIDLGEIPEALVAKAELLEQAKALGKFDDPITMVEDAFGAEHVAFIVGDSGSSRRTAMREFQAGTRSVAFLSQAGSTGINLDHRIRTPQGPGHGRRVFIDVQYEWSATESLQRYGRVGRAASLTQPVIMPLTFGNASEKKFLATIANRMAAMGALSKGGAETTGTSALEQFEITGPDAAAAGRLAYNDLPQDAKRQFAVVKSVFRSPNRGPNDPFEPAATAPAVAGMKDFQLALLFVPIDTSNAFWQGFITHREEVRETMGHQGESRTQAFTGKVLRTTELGTKDQPLTLTEVQNEKGQKFGILSGLVTPRMPKIRDFLVSDEDAVYEGQKTFKRRYVTFSAGQSIVSGLRIPWQRVKALADSFGAALATEQLDTPAKVLAALKSGEKVALQHQGWTLRWRKDEKIAIDGALMADRQLLLHNGGGYAPVGNVWFTTADKLAQFLERFPVAQTPAPAPKRSASSSGGLQSALVPGLKEFVEQDVVPGVTHAAADLNAARVDIKGLFAPAAVSPAARDFSHIVRANIAARDQKIERARRAMRTFEKAFDRALKGATTPAAKADILLAFTDAVEAGESKGLPGPQREAAALFRELLNGRRAEVQRLGKMQEYIEHYFPHEWAQPSQSKNALLKLFGKRPMEGPKAFLKQRTIPTVREGIKAGLVPVSYNPVELVLRKLVEMDKFIAVQRILRDGLAQGLAAYVPVGAEPPEGWYRFNHSFATVYGKPVVEVKEAFDPDLREGLQRVLDGLNVKHDRAARIGGKRWGYAEGGHHIVTKFAGPEGVIMHELGHILDERFGLRQALVNNKKFRQELRDLADLRHEGQTVPASRLRYERKGEEKIANLLHAFLYAPDRTKKIAPNSYWLLYNLIKGEKSLRGLLDVQKTRSLKLGVGRTEIPIGGALIKGYYYGPPEVVRLLDNHLSPGLRGSTAFNLYRRAGNFLNQVQLGLSAFHFTMTGMESVISKQSLALELLSRGQVGQALRKQLQVPIAPLVDIMRGHQALKQFYARDASAQTLDDLIGSVVQGGGGFGWSLFEHEGAPAKFMQALRQGNYPGAALRAIPALVELQAKPIMEGWVPRLKMNAFLDIMRMELPTLGPDPDRAELRRVAAEAWDSIDNRFGQLRYDNLFWHTALKDLGMASVRALGWNVGSVREAFGAPGAQLRQIGLLPGAGAGGSGGGGKRPLRMVNAGVGPDGGARYEHVKEPWLHRKAAWLIATVFIYGLAGAIYQYLHTGSGPKERKDYFFPKDESGKRVSLPGYMKDWYAFAHDPVTTVTRKANPLLTLLADLLENEDYFNTAIRDSDDPVSQQLRDVFTYVGNDYKPISVHSFQQRRADQLGRTGTGADNAVESLFGIARAPASVTRSPAEELVRRYHPPQSRTQAQAADADLTRTIRQGLQAKTPAGRAAAVAAARSGNLSKGQIQAAVRGARLTALQGGVQGLTLDQTLRVYQVASEDERALLRPLVLRKVASIDTAAPNDRASLRTRARAALALPYTHKAPIEAAFR